MPTLDQIITLLPDTLLAFNDDYIPRVCVATMNLIYDPINGTSCAEGARRGDFLDFNSVFQNIFRRLGINKLIDLSFRTTFSLYIYDNGGDIANIELI